MAIKKQNKRANFTPTFAGAKSNGRFRFWCQKVLPLVYDDSLSYYELLGKVIDYLNHVIEDVGSTETNVDRLLNAYNELQGYVNNYFDTVDLQGEINKRLDEMTEDGTFYELFGDDMVEAAGSVMEQWIQEHIEAQVEDPPMVLITDKSLSVAGDVADSYSCGNSIINLFNMIAPKYDSTHVYNKGDYCIVRYNSWPWGGENIWDLSPIPAKLYRCKINMQAAESWNAEHWDLIGNFSREISTLLQNIYQIQTLFGMWGDIGSALQTCFENVAWANQNGEEYIDDLIEAINNANPVDYITAVFNQGQNIIYNTDSLDDLRQYLTVTAYYEDGTHATKTTYTLNGTLTTGTSEITVSYAGKTATFDVTVTAVLYNLENQITSGNYIETQINLLQANFPFTIFFDFTNTANPTSGSGNGSLGKWLFEYNSSNRYRGLCVGKNAGTDSSLSLWWNSDTPVTLSGTTPAVGRHRIVVTHEADSDLLKIKYRKDNGTVLAFSNSNTFTTTVPTETNTGFYFGTSGNHGLPAGTLSLARIYGDVLSDERINAFFA